MHAPASVCRMSDLGGELDALASGTGFSGVVRIDQSDRIELARAYGLAHRGFEIPNAVDTRFGLASGAKGFTALAVVSLIEEGVLELSTPARSVLGSDLPVIDDGVTVEHLLSHRSGIGDYLDEEAGFEVEEYVMPVPVHELATTEDYLAVLDGHASKFAPGERFAYCNAGYVVLALIAERASGMPFHELVEQRVCRRAGLTDTAFLRSDELPRPDRPRLRRGRRRVEEQRLPSPRAGERRRRDLLHGRGHELVLAGVLRRSDRLHGLGLGDGSAAQRRAETLEALRAGLLAPRVERRRPPGGARRGCLVPVRARSARTRDAHGDLEHERWRVADRSVSRECGFKLSDFPCKTRSCRRLPSRRTCSWDAATRPGRERSGVRTSVSVPAAT